LVSRQFLACTGRCSLSLARSRSLLSATLCLSFVVGALCLSLALSSQRLSVSLSVVGALSLALALSSQWFSLSLSVSLSVAGAKHRPHKINCQQPLRTTANAKFDSQERNTHEPNVTSFGILARRKRVGNRHEIARDCACPECPLHVSYLSVRSLSR